MIRQQTVKTDYGKKNYFFRGEIAVGGYKLWHKTPQEKISPAMASSLSEKSPRKIWMALARWFLTVLIEIFNCTAISAALNRSK